MQVHYNLLNGRAPDRSRALLTVAPASRGAHAAADGAPARPGRARLREGRAGEALRPERGALRSRAEVRLERRVRRRPVSSSSVAEVRRTRPRAPSRRATGASRRRRRSTSPPATCICSARRSSSSSTRGRPQAKVLLDIPRWNFHWQNAYTLAEPVKAEPGDVVRVTCRHDVAQAHARWPRHPEDAALHPLGRGHDRRDVPRDPAGHARVASATTPASRLPHDMRILLVSQMYPGPDDPDLGVFVANLERELVARGHEIERAVVDSRSGGKRRHVASSATPARRHARFHPDVAYAHFLVPAGLAAALATRAPLVVTAHGQDVANIGSMPGVRAATRHVVRRAATVIAVSRWLRDRLDAAVPEAGGKTEVVDCGVDLERFAPRDAEAARAEVGLERQTGPRSSASGGSSERKNVLRLARAFERRGEGSLAFVGDGPLRAALEGRPGIRLVGRVGHDAVPAWIAACRRRLPAEPRPSRSASRRSRHMASARSVVATSVGGPPRVRDARVGCPRRSARRRRARRRRCREAAALPRPNLAGRDAAGDHDVRLQAERVEEILLRAVRDRRA